MQRESELPHIPVDVNGTKFTALVDSGSAATILSSHAWEQILNKPELQPGASVQLRSVTGNVLPHQGETKLPITIGGQTTTVTVQIISGIPFHCILGINFIRDSQMQLSASDNCVQIGVERMPFTSRCGNYNGPRAVTSIHSITLEPQQGAILTVKADLIGKGKQIIDFVPLCGGDGTRHPVLQTTAVLGETNDSGLFQITIANPSDQTIEVPAGSVLGTTTQYEGTVAAVTFDHDNSNNTDDKHAGEGRTGMGTWMGRWKSREVFLKQFDLEHLEGTVKREVEELLCRYESIFASHDFDLGHIQIAAHTITIQPNTAPVYCRPFRCSEAERGELQRQLELMLKHGVIEPVYDGYRSPVLQVLSKPRSNSSPIRDSRRGCKNHGRGMGCDCRTARS